MKASLSLSGSTTTIDRNDYVVVSKVDAMETELGGSCYGNDDNDTYDDDDDKITTVENSIPLNENDDDEHHCYDETTTATTAAAATTTTSRTGCNVGSNSSSRSSGGSSSLTGAIVGIVKGMVGPAILFLPHGFATTGYVLAIPIMVCATVLYLYSATCLLDSWTYETYNNKQQQQKQQQHVSHVHSQTEQQQREEEEEVMMPLQQQEDSSTGTLSSSSLSTQQDNRHQRQQHEEEETSRRSSSSLLHDDDDDDEERILSTMTLTTVGPQPQQRRPSLSRLSYSELAYRAYGPRGRTVIQIGIATMQSGVCLTYLIFVSHNLHTSFTTAVATTTTTTVSSDLTDIPLPPRQFWLLVMLLVEIPLSWIQDISHLVITNSIANGLISYGLLTCLAYAIHQVVSTTVQDGGVVVVVVDNVTTTVWTPVQQEQQVDTTAEDISTSMTMMNTLLTNIQHHWEQLTPLEPGWFLFIGTSVLLFEGSITLLVPLQESVRDPIDRRRFSSMYKYVILSIVMFYAIFGTTCWMAFGRDVHTVLTTSLPGGVLSATVQLAYSIAVMFTFPLQHLPALEICTRSIASCCTSLGAYRKKTSVCDGHRGCCCCYCCTSTCTTTTPPPPSSSSMQQQQQHFVRHRNVIATTMVCLLGLIAFLTMESLDKVVSLMGSLLGCPIAFCFPPLIHCRLDPTLPPWRVRTNYVVASLGLAAMVLASFTTIVEWHK